MEVIETDVLIIGSGASGLRASIETSKKYETVVVDKGKIGISSSSFLAEAGINTIIEREDSEDIFFEDIIRAGRYINDYKLVRILVSEINSRIKDLEEFGLKFNYSPRKLGGSRFGRTIYINNRTGEEIVKILIKEARNRGVIFLEDKILIDLIKKNGKVLGGIFYDARKGEVIAILSKKTIIATGGACNLYKITTNPLTITGEALSICYRNGAILSDLEFVQFHPTSINIEGFRGIMLTEALRYEGARIINKYGERFVNELETRDIITRKIFEEIEKGNSPIYLDISNVNIEEKFPILYKFLKDNKLPLDKIEIIPSAHYFLGGLVIDERCRTNLKNLYACGEVTSGIHGANRIAGNSLADTQVFGYRAGVFCIKEIDEKRENVRINLSEIKYYEEYLFKRRKGENVFILIDNLREIMFKYVGIVRDEISLKTAKNIIERMSRTDVEVDEGKIYNISLIKFLEFKNMLILSKLIIDSSLRRRESRGCFYRKDYPFEDESYRMRIYQKTNSKRDFFRI